MADEVNPAGLPQPLPDVIVKFVLEMSKKILPTASTLILAVVVGVFGIVTTSLPSLVVLATRVEKLFPPSVEMEILTLAQLTGAAVVFATAQVIVWDELPAHDTAVFGTVTEKGPELFVTVTTTSSKLVWPTLTGAVELNTALSLTVRRKFNVLETELNASVFAPASPPGNGPDINPPARIVDIFGKYLVGDVVGLKEIQLGPVALVALATLLALVCEEDALSFCSQQNVSTSPALASVAEPVRAKGVLMGIVKLLPAFTTGVALFAATLVVTGQVLVPRLDCIWAIEAW
jgi:hypothetical protein